MSNFNIPDEKLSAMLNMAGNKLGRDPEELRSKLQSGDVNGVLNGLDPKSAGQINNILKDPKALEAMMGNPAVKNLLNGLLGKK